MRKKTRRMSIKAKILLLTNLIIIALFLLAGVNIYQRMEQDMVSMGIEQATAAARMAVGQIDGTEVGNLVPGDETGEAYQKNLQALQKLKKDCGVAYLYTLSTDGNTVSYGIDTDESEGRAALERLFRFPMRSLHRCLVAGNMCRTTLMKQRTAI